MNRADVVTSIIFATMGLGALWVAAGYPPEARLIPSVVASAIVVIAALQLGARVWSPLRPLAAEDPKVAYGDAPTDAAQWRRAGAAALSVLALFVLVGLAGIVIGLTLYIPLALAFHARKPPLALLAGELLTFGLSYGMFVALMELPILGGWLG
jgi:hypothetical protein